ncbi:hypothetical protein ASG22_09790 [Chryseobacterium sp. Leaf405]|uniref:hypothetical protein n=1 Tax=Chryseobacterium sp. Leaf405 TaxID=1736367 RepID=UPI0006F6920C|nr:hypothetical protein [Chryseobacterium sp. Leaf405]KQT24293.1 hypothetical protein ASG22_09790 [Chryseobacterium sp. Leaf405]
MSDIGKIIRVNALPPVGERETNVIYQVAAPGAATYTDYAIDANGDLKTHAVVEGSIPVELSDDHVSISDLDLLAEGIATQAEFNSDTRQKLDLKLEIPSVEGNSQYFPKIIGLDDNGNIAKLPAGDLGKNMMNADLTNTSARNHTLNAPFSISTLGNEYKISGLPNKNTDVANFQKVMVQNSAGVNAIVDNKNLLIGTPQQMTEAERTAWKTAMNGGWSTNTMSVAFITPPVIDKQDRNSWITLRGANLNLNPATFSVEIMANDGVTSLAIIPNSQVQLYSNGLDLTFYYNFKNLPLGKYKIRLWNGIAYYVTPVTVEVVAVLDVINLNNLVWETKLFTPNTPDVVTVAGGSMSYNASTANKTFARENIVVAALKSSEFVSAGQNFIMSGTLRLRDDALSLMNIILGVINKNNTLALTNNANFQISINANNIANNTKTIFGDNLFSMWTSNDSQVITNWSIARNNGLFTVLIKYGSSINMSTRIGIDEALSLVCYINNTANNDNTGADAGFNIQSAYRF